MSWMRRALDGASELPGAGLVRNTANELETRLLSELKARLDELSEEDAYEAVSGVDRMPAAAAQRSVSEQFAQLTQASVDQNASDGLEAWQRWILGQLVPDELRILRCASDGSGIAVSHLEVTGRLGGEGERLRSNLSRVAQEAGVMVAVAVPGYLNHLTALGLLQPGPEDRQAGDKYDVIESESAIRKLCTEVETVMKRRARFQRRTLALSEAGEFFLRTCAHRANNEQEDA